MPDTLRETQPEILLDTLLSREELLCILRLLGAGTIPGIEENPEGALTPEEEAVALRTAAHGLRARQLAWHAPGQPLAIRQDLLAAVGACAFADTAVFAYSWEAGQELPVPCLMHRRNGDLVMHTRPADVLHQLTQVPDADAAAQRILAFCHCTGGFGADEAERSAAAGEWELRVGGAIFAQARALAANGRGQQGADLLRSGGADGRSAEILAETLAGAPRAANLQLVRRAGNGVERKDLVLLLDGQRTWLVSSADATDEGSTPQVTVRTVTIAALQELLAQWLAPQHA